MIYRNRKEPFDIPNSETRDFFRSSPPSIWTASPEWCQKFEDIYGLDARIRAVDHNLVPENIDPAWVGGTNWSGKVFDEAGNVAFKKPVAEELPPPPWEQPGFTGLSKGEDLILNAVLRLEQYLFKKLG